MALERFAAAVAEIALILVARSAGAVTLEPHADVHGPEATTADVRGDGDGWRAVAWDDLSTTGRDPGRYDVRFAVDGGASGVAVMVPHCAGRKRVAIDGAGIAAPIGPVVVDVGPGRHEVLVGIEVSKYERRIACGERPRTGTRVHTVEGLGVLAFGSPYVPRGGGTAVVFVPPGHDVARPSVLLVGLHPWNGTPWTYAAYAELLREARVRDVVLLFPSGLGNSLYTADADDEAMRSIDALAQVVSVDPRAVSLWGASMGGAGATTVGFHHPDRFAGITSFFGDSKYDVTTYVRALLPDDAAAHGVNALDVVENALHLPVWLVHGEVDRTSPIRQSEMLADAMRARHLDVQFDRVPHAGHQGSLVARFATRVVDRAATVRIPDPVKRVTYRSVRPWDAGAYGVRLVRRAEQGDAVVDVEARDDGVHVLRAENIRAIVLAPGALGTSAAHPAPVVLDGARDVTVTWAGRTP
jgi:pimeloyl-ACP methyl ester carboxylesterase